MPAPTFRANMSSFIRDTLYSMPQRGSDGTPSSARGAKPPPSTAGASHGNVFAPNPPPVAPSGSHSSKFAVLNQLQQQQNPTFGSAGLSIGGTSAPNTAPTGSARTARTGPDLSSLLANQASGEAKPQTKPLTSSRVPRTLSGRPRPPLTARDSGSARPSRGSTGTSASTGSANDGGLAVLPSAREEDRPDAHPTKGDDAPAQLGIAPGIGNATARGKASRPGSAAVPVEQPLSARPSLARDEPPTRSIPAAAPGEMAALGGPAGGPEFRGMNPARVVALYESDLTKFERREVLDYDDIYFIGPNANKTQAPVPNAPNSGYDDDRGDYIVCMRDHIAYRYEVLGELGRGSFGQVLRVHDYKRNVDCAVKIIRNRKKFHQQAQVEIRLLEHLRSRDPEDRSCTIRMLNYFVFRSHTCITFELHSMNLFELTKLNKYQPFPPALIKRFTGQLLVALSFMWRENIVHCDMKPENILLKQENKTGIKVIDFGSSCFENERVYSYIQSRFYRAPEIMLGMPYGRPIDLWSLGCIICEMAIGFPIFPGENEHEQLLCIMEVLGVPPARLVEKSPRRAKLFDSNNQPRLVPNSRNKVRHPSTKDLQSVLRTDDTSFVDFILCFLRWDPTERITPNDAMRHPFIAECFHQDTIPQSQVSGGASTARRPNSSVPTQPPQDKPRSARAPPLHQLGALSGHSGSQTTRSQLPTIGGGVLPSSSKRHGKTSSGNRMQFASNELFA